MTSEQRSGANRSDGAAAGIAGAGAALSRKQLLILLGGGAVGAASASLAGCASERAPIGEEGRADLEVLNDALELEHTGVAVYRAEPDPLGDDLREIALQFAGQAAERVARLTTLVEERGGTPRLPRPDEEYLEDVEVTEVEDEAGFIRVAIELENQLVAGYTESVAELSAPDLRRTLYELAGNSAAHISVLLGAAGRVQVPDALVTGQPA